MRKGSIAFAAFVAVATLAVCFVVYGCWSRSSKTATQKTALPTPASNNSNSADLSSAASGFERFQKLYPNATVLHPLDPHTLTESQIRFGVAPQRDPSVEYQPNIILMENGDKAIKSVASDGLTWTFDANAPQVSEFAEDKIVFATGRAVGRVLSLKREGDNVRVVLGPVELTDLIRNGSFEMDAAVDLSNAVSYVAPDYPEPSDDDQLKISLNHHAPVTHASVTYASAHRLRGPGNAGIGGARLVHAAFQRGPLGSKIPDIPQVPPVPKWKAPKDPKIPDARQGIGAVPGVLNTPLPKGLNGQDIPDVPYGPSLHLPGIAGVEGISPLKIVEEPFDPPKLMGQTALIELAGGRAIPINGSDTSVGMEYDYDNDGLKIRASGKLILGNSGIRFFLHINNGGVQDCGIRLSGNMAIKLRLNARALNDFNSNFHKTLYLPIDISLPLGGPVPLSLTFTSSFVLHSAFSAKGSVLNARGDYSFGAGMDAGYWDKAWRFNAGAAAKADTDIADTVEGISVGVNSVILGFGERALVGVGAFGLKAGVFVAVRFTGSAAKAPNITYPCRQGTMDISLETGVGYSLAEWLKNAINFFLQPLTRKTVDRAGTFLRGPVKSIYHKVKDVPSGCVTNGG